MEEGNFYAGFTMIKCGASSLTFMSQFIGTRKLSFLGDGMMMRETGTDSIGGKVPTLAIDTNVNRGGYSMGMSFY